MGRLIIAGLGLYDLRDLTLGLLEKLKEADRVFIESYTSVIPNFNIKKLEKLIQRKIKIVRRYDLEELSGGEVLEAAKKGIAVLLVPGNPFVATTHISLVIEASSRGIDVEILPAASVLGGIIIATGLQVYKFGKIATLVFPNEELGFYPFSTYRTIMENLRRGLHTLLLLDLKVDEGIIMGIQEAISVLEILENRIGENIINSDTVLIGVARATSPDQMVYAGRMDELRKIEWGDPPFSIIIPGILHPSEIDFLVKCYNANREVLEKWNLDVKRKFISI